MAEQWTNDPKISELYLEVTSDGEWAGRFVGKGDYFKAKSLQSGGRIQIRADMPPTWKVSA